MANAQVNVKFIPNAQGGQNLVCNDYKFRIKPRKNCRTYWVCCKKNCPARVITHEGIIVSSKNHDNHTSEESDILVQDFLQSLKEKARVESKTVPELYKEELNAFSSRTELDVVAAVPTFYSIQSSLYRSRSKVVPALPRDPADVQLPQAYTLTSSGEDFLLFQQEKILCFSTTKNLYYLSLESIYYCDGTFYTSPNIFYQLYTIHAIIQGKMVPLVYALLPDKKQSTYKCFFQTLRQTAADHNILLNHTTMVTDFEVGAQNAALETLKAFLFKQLASNHDAQSITITWYKSNHLK